MSTSRAVAAVGAFALLLASPARGAAGRFTGPLTGSAGNPPTFSPATGFATISLNLATHQLTVEASFSGLTGGATSARLHCCVESPGNVVAAMVFYSFPAGSSGTYGPVSFDTGSASTYTAGFVTANGGSALSAEGALASGLAQGRAYFTIGSETYPSGEIRGFMVPSMPFYTLAPCRLVEIQPDGSGKLAPSEARTYRVPVNRCLIPSTARALSVNATVVTPAVSGFLALYAGSLPTAPTTSTLNFNAGQTRGNNAIVALSSDGTMALVMKNASAGILDVLIDVNGYFAIW